VGTVAAGATPGSGETGLTAAAVAVLFSVAPTSLALIAAVGIFVIGIVAGVITVVSHGIRQEERRFQAWRRFQEENGIWGSPDAPNHYIHENDADAVSSVGRSVNGLYVRHLPKILQELARLLPESPPP
jgi:hypothetical protein